MRVPFIKMQGLGNDFIVIDSMSNGGSRLDLTPDSARKLCDRRFGIGADQILWLKQPEKKADARMEILNADGSIAEMCGNGIRAVGLYLFRSGPSPGQASYAIETLAGLKQVEVRGDQVKVDMGAPGLGARGEKLRVGSQDLIFEEVNMGNPHAVFFSDDVARIPLEDLGPKIEIHSRFPKKTNVEFVQVVDDYTIRVSVWERGAGITLACGTGACASAVASIQAKRVSSPVQVHLPGGVLTIEWNGPGHPVMMTGPAMEVFRGETSLA